MNYSKILISNFYQSIKKELWLHLLANISVGTALYFLNLPSIISLFITIGMLFHSFTFRKHSLVPSMHSNVDLYSWKYLQGVPLNKRDLILSLILSELILVLPLSIWMISFWDQYAFMFASKSWKLQLGLFFSSFPFFASVTLLRIRQIITFPRTQFSKRNIKIAYLQFFKNLFTYFVILFYGGSLLKLMGLDLVKGIEFSLSAVDFIFDRGIYIPLCIIWTMYFFKDTIKLWQDEKRSYVNQLWTHKKDTSILAISFLMLFIPSIILDFTTPRLYGDSKMVRAVYEKDYKKISQLLESGMSINQTSKNGFSPIMVAMHEGDYEMYKFLLSKKASLLGLIHIDKDLYHSGMTTFLVAVDGKNSKIVEDLLSKGFGINEINPWNQYSALHLAAFNCDTKLIDVLIEHKIDQKALNKFKETPLHIAAKKGCFSGVATLLDAGIDPLLKNDKGLMAFEVVDRKRKQDLVDYLEKRTRAPASK